MQVLTLDESKNKVCMPNSIIYGTNSTFPFKTFFSKYLIPKKSFTRYKCPSHSEGHSLQILLAHGKFLLKSKRMVELFGFHSLTMAFHVDVDLGERERGQEKCVIHTIIQQFRCV
jgi:hypothetical protein